MMAMIFETFGQTALNAIAQIMVAVIGAGAVVYAAIITKRKSDIKKQLDESKTELSKVFKIVKHPTDEFAWLYDKYQFLDNAFDGYCVINPQNQEEYISDRICQLIGKKRGELGKTVDTLLQYVDHGDFAQFESMVKLLLDGKIERSSGTKRLKTSSSQWAEFEITAVLDGPFILTIWKFMKYEPMRAQSA